METMASFKIGIYVAVIGSLGLVSTLSIKTGASASHAIVAIRVAHLEHVLAKIAFRDPAVDEAEFHLNEAWSRLRDRQYEQSILAAYKAVHRVTDIVGEVSPLHSDTGTARRATNRNPDTGHQR